MKKLREWATPLTVGSFVIMAVTGILMFYHTSTGTQRFLHEWVGWVMVFAVALHLIPNWRPFLGHLKRPVAQGILAVSAVVVAVSFLPLVNTSSPMRLIAQSMGDARIETVIELSGRELDEGLIVLEQAGFTVQPGATVSEITGGNGGLRSDVIRALFEKE